MPADLYVYGEGHEKGRGNVDLSHVCLKIFNINGDELSISFDDSCGAFRHLQRTEACLFPSSSPHTCAYTQQGIGADDLLKLLANHLGYRIEKGEL